MRLVCAINNESNPMNLSLSPLRVLLTITLLLVGCPALATASDTKPILPSLAPMLQKVMPAIVNIAVQGEMADETVSQQDDKQDDNGKNNPSTPQQNRKFAGIASGVIMDTAKGYIITNAHVVKDAKTVTITLNDGRRLKAKIIGDDPDSDIAVIQIDATHLSTLPVSDSDKVQVGDFVVAIGNPFGLNSFGGSNQSATFGIVSALQRSELRIEGVENFIQTDAAINPGNSGGALINLQGELIGINTAVLAPFDANVGIGFAIPINMARNIMEQIIKFGSVHRGLMGVIVQQLTPELAHAFKIPLAKGALVAQVNMGSPAEKAGLKTGDIIQTINTINITDAAQVKNIISLLRVGSTVTMKVLRNGSTVTIKANVVDVKLHQEQEQSQNPFLYGMALQDFNQELPIHGHVIGVQVVGLSQNSAGWRAGLRPGDVIISANQKPATNVEALKSAAQQSKNELLVQMLRGPVSLFMIIK